MRIPSALFAGCAALLLGLVPARAEDNALRLCADAWMPFNGDPNDNRPGYVVELTRTIFTPLGVSVDYTVLPWEDALAAVREGRMGAVIGANTTEAEGLVIPKEPIGAPPTCLMTRADSTWTYDNLMSFRRVKLGVIKDYSYWPSLDGYIAKQAGTSVVVVEGEDPLDELMRMLDEKQIEVIVESEPVLLWHLRAHELDRARFRVVYKHEAESIYLAFAPTAAGRKHAAMFDAGIQAMRQSGELEKVLRRYGLRDWQ